MTITKRDDRWYDENDNSWLSEEAATLYSPTLTSCYNCSNCSYCDDCSNCSNCSNCSDCYSCIDCSSCSSCINCSSCIDCYDCNDCKYVCCLTDRTRFTAQFEPATEDTIIRPELDINNRRLEIEL